MTRALPSGIPSIEQTRHSRESLVGALSNDSTLPSTAIALATVYAHVIEPDIVAVLQRALHEELDVPSGRLLFRGIHILGGRRLSGAYRPLLAFLRGPQDRVDALLGDAVTENLSQILAGLFDGDQQPLRDLVSDASVDTFVRDAALKALTFLAFDGRIDRTAFEDSLLRFDKERLAADEDNVMWDAWMTAVAMLGVATLVPRVRAAFGDGRLAPDYSDEGHFDALIQAAVARPDDRTRLAAEQMGYLEDALAALEKFAGSEDNLGIEDEPIGDGLDSLDVGVPARNPFRAVGRNDPCPCGSGKKFKKCCLRQALGGVG